MHGIVYIDKSGKPVSPLFTWKDGRGERLLAKVDQTYSGYLSEITGYPLSTGFGSVTHFYNMLNGQIFKEAISFCTIADALALALTGRLQVHTTNAASIGLLKLPELQWDKNAIETAGMDPSVFPQLIERIIPIGETVNGIPVMPAIGDSQASFLGSISDIQKSLLINIGTGGQVSFWTKQIEECTIGEYRPFIDSDYLWTGAALCGGRAYALLENFFREILNGNGIHFDNIYGYMDNLANQAFDLKSPLLIKTSFGGTRKDPSVKGSIENLGTSNFTPAHFVSGVLHGIANELTGMYNKVEKVISKKHTILIGSGNGLRKSKILQKIFEKKLGMTMQIPVHQEEASLGAAILALAGSNICPSIMEAQKLIKYN
jgi:sedoheptulokinase